jgi:hypothetical protein
LRIYRSRVSKDASVQLFSGADFEMRGFAVLLSMKAGVRLGGRQFREPWPSILGRHGRESLISAAMTLNGFGRERKTPCLNRPLAI